jgi:hypothetical protein
MPKSFLQRIHLLTVVACMLITVALVYLNTRPRFRREEEGFLKAAYGSLDRGWPLTSYSRKGMVYPASFPQSDLDADIYVVQSLGGEAIAGPSGECILCTVDSKGSNHAGMLAGNCVIGLALILALGWGLQLVVRHD